MACVLLACIFPAYHDPGNVMPTCTTVPRPAFEHLLGPFANVAASPRVLALSAFPLACVAKNTQPCYQMQEHAPRNGSAEPEFRPIPYLATLSAVPYIVAPTRSRRIQFIELKPVCSKKSVCHTNTTAGNPGRYHRSLLISPQQPYNSTSCITCVDSILPIL